LVNDMAPSTPQITTIICTYRRPQWLRRAILSAQKQTYSHIKICVYDNASGDETPQVVAELAQQDPRIHYVGRPENIGLLANYAEAMTEVTTPFFSFLADDDVILPDFYATAIAALEAQPEAMFFAGSFLALSLQGNRVGGSQFVDRCWLPPEGMWQFVSSKIDPNLHGTLIRREVLHQGYHFSPVLNWADRDLLYRIAARHPILTGADITVLFTHHNLDKGGKMTIDFAWRENESLLASLQPLLDTTNGNALQALLHGRTRESIYLLGIEMLYGGDFAGARLGARKLRQDYRVFWPPLALDLLAGVLSRLPWLHWFLVKTRDLRPPAHHSATQSNILDYEVLLDIHRRLSSL
jgi:glycosyltransferase involved in cell wall biosynthesis